jgi:hypothetical protein
MDIARLNFGILSLLPKVPGADNIKQYRPIALINVIFKLISKAFACRLSPMAHRVINQSQTAFIKGRFIQDGPLALHEIINELKSKNLLQSYSNWTLKKRMTESTGSSYKRYY